MEKGEIQANQLDAARRQLLLQHRDPSVRKRAVQLLAVATNPDRKKVLEIREMYIDVGATSDWDVKKKLDIRPGDPIIPDSKFTQMANPNLMLAKAWDNRIGCALAAVTAASLKEVKHPNTVYAVATVQEEVGLRGAQTSAFKIQPDVGIALDVGIAHDIPGTEGDEKLGGGPLVVAYDSSAIPNRNLLDLVDDTARKLKMKA